MYTSKYSIIILVPFLLISTLIAQKPAIKWGQEEKVERATYNTGVIGVTGRGHYEVHYVPSSEFSLGGIPVTLRPEKFTVEQFNTDLKTVAEYEFDLSWEKKRRFFYSCVYLKGQLYVLSRFYDKKNDKNELYVDQIDLQSMKKVGSPEMIAAIPAKRQWNAGYFEVSVSPDSSKLLVFYDYPSPLKNSKDIKEIVGVTVYDKDLFKLWEASNIEFDVPSRKFSLNEAVVDNEGNAVIVAKAYKEAGVGMRERDRDGNPNYTYVFRGFRDGGTNIQDYTFEPGERFVSDFTVGIDSNQHVVCAGLLSNGRNADFTSGLFYFRLNPVIMAQYGFTEHTFGKETLSLLRWGEKVGSGELENWDLRQLILRRDGGAMVLLEHAFREYSTGTDNNTVEYHNHNVLAMSFSSAGNMEWVRLVPKRQEVGEVDVFNSYNAIVLRDRVVLIFNDNIENRNVKPGDRVRKMKLGKSAGVVTRVTITVGGDVRRDILYTFAQINKPLIPSFTVQYSRKHVLIMARRLGKYQRGRLTFN